jgi:hypothetical protein
MATVGIVAAAISEDFKLLINCGWPLADRGAGMRPDMGIKVGHLLRVWRRVGGGAAGLADHRNPCSSARICREHERFGLAAYSHIYDEYDVAG